jgi:F420H(2)-dependent quinone reductase
VSAREAEGVERGELWRLLNDNHNGYDVYRRRTGARRIPVMALTPR